MHKPVELSSGFHIATDTSKVTPTENGIFIPFPWYGTDMMKDLQAFLAKHFPEYQEKTVIREIDNLPGEGAHKIFAQLQQVQRQKDKECPVKFQAHS